MTTSDTHKYAGALLVTSENKLILQRRDNNPSIKNPGLITTFGGSVETGETPEMAIIRELAEELHLNVSNPLLYKTFTKTLKEHGEDSIFYIYLFKEVHTSNLEVFEGQGYQTISSPDEASSLPLTPMCLTIVMDYFNHNNSQ